MPPLLSTVRLAEAATGIPALPNRGPHAAHLISGPLRAADRAVTEAVTGGGVPGAVLLVARNGVVALRRAYGSAGLRPEKRPMTIDTLFDLASLTKVVATTTAIALLVEAGKVTLDTPVAMYLPPFAEAGGDRAKVTLRHLLTHTAGLPAGGPYAGKTVTLAEVVDDIARSRQVAPPGVQFLYSDFSAITLQAVIEAVGGAPLDVFCRDHIFVPLGMKYTTFRPGAAVTAFCAATTAGDDTPETRGIVHDPTARALGGVAGNAGLFATADDLARFCQMLLGGGAYRGVRLLKQETVRLFTSRQAGLADGERALGWDMDSPFSIRGMQPLGSYGHTGFTGTSIWIDPRTKTFVLLLTNAVHAQPPR